MRYVVNSKNEEYDVLIGRSTKWGNPWFIGKKMTRAQVVRKHRKWIKGYIRGPNGIEPPTKEEIIAELKGKRLGCYCYPLACHGEVLAEIANEIPRKGLFGRLGL